MTHLWKGKIVKELQERDERDSQMRDAVTTCFTNFNKYQHYQSVAESLESQLETLKSKEKETIKVKTPLAKKLDGLRDEMKILDGRVEDLSGQLVSLESSNNELHTKHNELTKNEMELKRKLQHEHERRLDVTASSCACEEKVGTELRELIKKNEVLQSELRRLETVVSKLARQTTRN